MQKSAKWSALALAGLMMLSLAACGSTKDDKKDDTHNSPNYSDTAKGDESGTDKDPKNESDMRKDARDAAKDTKDAAKDTKGAIKDAAKDTGDAIKDAGRDTEKAAKDSMNELQRSTGGSNSASQDRTANAKTNSGAATFIS